jgi:hypothetical protein
MIQDVSILTATIYFFEVHRAKMFTFQAQLNLIALETLLTRCGYESCSRRFYWQFVI